MAPDTLTNPSRGQASPRRALVATFGALRQKSFESPPNWADCYSQGSFAALGQQSPPLHRNRRVVPGGNPLYNSVNPVHRGQRIAPNRSEVEGRLNRMAAMASVIGNKVIP
jgi:hypothetical protein